MSESDPGGRRRVDLSALPQWVQLFIALVTVALVAGLALAFGHRGTTRGVPVTAIVVGVVALAYVALRVSRRR